MPIYHMKKFGLNDVPRKTNLYFIEGSYVDNIFVLFESQDKLIKFRDYFNGCYPNGCFHMKLIEGWKTKFFRCKMFSVKKGSL